MSLAEQRQAECRERVSKSLLRMFLDWKSYEETKTPTGKVTMDTRLAKAKFDGACVLAANAGFGSTDFDVHMKVADMVRSMGPRPPYHPMSNQRQQEWDAQCARQIEELL